MTYLTNIRLWLTGFTRFDEIDFKEGWSKNSPLWWLVYGLNYGTRVLFGGACVSWSRWFYLNSSEYRAAKFITRLLNRLDENHGRDSGDPLWGTEDTEYAREGAIAFWGSVAGLLLWLIW